MVKKRTNKRTHWEIHEEFGKGRGSRNKDWDHKTSWGGIGFGIFLIIIAILWIANDYGLIPSIPLWQTILFLFGLFIVISSLSKR